MVVLPSTDASRYHNSCIDGDTGPEYFGYTLVKNNEWAVAQQRTKNGKLNGGIVETLG
jgi:hypothetical protein